ncbi:hypothetical protein WMY93_031232 [Mugilogobius chulae]|uniref:Uncharacterized protein n=1 Tax=Mugilogobius chulae TaxID=88201 RepID=A0AAW0MF19_9GOBI
MTCTEQDCGLKGNTASTITRSSLKTGVTGPSYGEGSLSPPARLAERERESEKGRGREREGGIDREREKKREAGRGACRLPHRPKQDRGKLCECKENRERYRYMVLFKETGDSVLMGCSQLKLGHEK